MTTVFHSGNQGDADSPGTHVFIVGVGEYPCLLGGDPSRLLDKPMGLGQLSSPALSALALANWFIGPRALGSPVDGHVGFSNPRAPLASVEMLVSPGLTYQCTDGTTAAVDSATRENIDARYGAWLERAKSHPGNIAVLYFCGHGVAGSSDYILPSDFGSHKKNPWSDAIDITETARAARREVVGSLYFFIDACRLASRDSLMPGASPPALQYVDFDRKVLCFTRMLLWATGEGEPAFGARGQASRFTSALIEALSGFYGEEVDSGSWAVTGEALAKSVRTILDANNASLDGSMHQHVESQLIGSQVLHYEAQPPKTVGRMVSTWAVDPLAREMAQLGGEVLGQGAQEALAEKLEQRNLQIDELRREIEEWTRRYLELEQRLADEPDSELAQQARSYLAAGKLEEVGALLDALIRAAECRLEEERERLASRYLSRAEIYELLFKPSEALPFFRRAYEISSEESRYARRYARALHQQKDHQRAETIYTSALFVLRKHAVDNPATYRPAVAGTLNNLGVLYNDTQRLAEAETAYREALDIYRMLAKANPVAYWHELAFTLNNLGVLYTQTKRLAEAEVAYREALDMSRMLAEASPAAYLPEVAMTLHNLGELYHATQRLNDAGTAYHEALNVVRKLAEANPAAYLHHVAGTLNNLAVLYSDMQHLAEAEVAYREALDIRQALAEVSPATYRPDVAVTLICLGRLYSQTRRPTEAETAYRAALDTYVTLAADISAAYQRDVAMAFFHLGVLYSQTQRRTEAETAYREALDIYRMLAGENPAAYRSYVAATLDNLSNLYIDTQRLAEAETAYREALDIYRVLAGANPEAYGSNVAVTLDKLGNLYSNTQRLAEAEPWYREALDIRRTLAGANPPTYQPDVAVTLNNLGNLYSNTQRLAEAETAYREALDIRRALAAANPAAYNSYVAMTLNNLAALYCKIQRGTEAETVFQQALDIFRSLEDANPAAYLRYEAGTLNNLGVLYSDMQRPAEAETAYREALEIYRRLAESSPTAYEPYVTQTVQNLAALQEDNERPT
ncbi:tetratricopeptide repeat protein [Paraburkholderia sp. CNPSo 3272]|uniref:tetratricopeptide repeat protein n=1 Tax=Paraburkholderia sp. CNPSo 3272 TaxID=2940931 RepID=UPI0020B783DE|nr:tetratricopeptide repeat protein [Paraburkholderia sp. CNPSo 3272]MCP3722581.1 tetratricopeptide repeat protein [Paraburkholderia sp. CNPSo 3272]